MTTKKALVDDLVANGCDRVLLNRMTNDNLAVLTQNFWTAAARAARRFLHRMPDNPNHYFHTNIPGTKLVPMHQLVPIRARPDGIKNAAKYMRMAKEGKMDKRVPLSVEKRADGKYTVMDGNSTFAVAKIHGFSHLPVIEASTDKIKELAGMPAKIKKIKH